MEHPQQISFLGKPWVIQIYGVVFLGIRRNLVITGVYIESNEKTHIFFVIWLGGLKCWHLCKFQSNFPRGIKPTWICNTCRPCSNTWSVGRSAKGYPHGWVPHSSFVVQQTLDHPWLITDTFVHHPLVTDCCNWNLLQFNLHHQLGFTPSISFCFNFAPPSWTGLTWFSSLRQCANETLGFGMQNNLQQEYNKETHWFHCLHCVSHWLFILICTSWYLSCTIIHLFDCAYSLQQCSLVTISSITIALKPILWSMKNNMKYDESSKTTIISVYIYTIK